MIEVYPIKSFKILAKLKSFGLNIPVSGSTSVKYSFPPSLNLSVLLDILKQGCVSFLLVNCIVWPNLPLINLSPSLYLGNGTFFVAVSLTTSAALLTSDSIGKPDFPKLEIL